MKNLFRLSLLMPLIFALSSFTVNSVQKWKVDPAHTNIGFSINHFFTPVNGSFDEYEGSLQFDPDDLAGSSVEFNIKVASVDTKNKKRDNHLQSGDFFNAEQFPDIHFVSDNFEKTDGSNYVAHGQLTIRDVTKEFDLPFAVLGVTEHPMMKGTTVMGIQAEAELLRNDYGVGAGKWATDMVVGNKVKLNIILEVNG